MCYNSRVTTRIGHLLPGILAACSLAACVWVLASELAAFRSAVGGWAERDMRARTLLAADSLGPAIATGDFRRIREFGDGCRDDGVRLTILSVAGGIIYDSSTSPVGGHRTRPEIEGARNSADHVGTAIRRSPTTGTEMFYCAQLTGESIVRLAVPLSRFYAPFQRARLGLVLAGLVGAASFLFIFIFTHQLRARIRERERQLAELRRAERFRSEFIANLTHEIKTPLTGILGAVDLLDGGDELPQDNRKTLYGLLRGESVRLNVLAQDILELAHLEEQQRDENHDFAPADLADIVRSVQMRLQPKADAANVRLVAGDLPSVTVPCDARLVEHAVANLVENALRYSGSPDIALSIAVRDGKAVLAVEDHGVGIAPEHRGRIFERFYRVDKDRSREQGGTGLGLAIVKHIAQLHHGAATLEPVAGGGCRFELSLPLA